jgi:hypothetical protein
VSGTAGATTLTTPQIPSHTHSATNRASNPQAVPNNFTMTNTKTQNPSYTASVSATGGDGSHDHPFSFSSGSGTFTGSAINLAVKYYDFIIATID